MKKQLLIIFLLAIMLAFCACLDQNGADVPETDTPDAEIQPILIKIGHELAETHALHLALLDFAARVEELSEGHFAVEIYPYFELGDAPELVALTSSGVIQMSFPLSSDLAALPPESMDDYLLTIPGSWQVWGSMDGFYQYADFASAMAAVDGELGADMAAVLADLEQLPLLCLGFAYDGQLCIASSSGAIISPADIRGRRIAISGSDAWIELYEGLNARTQALPLSELYPSLMREEISLYQATPANIATMYLDDHSSTLTLSEHAYALRPLLVNRAWYGELSDEDRELLASCIALFLADQRQLAAEQHLESIEELRQRGMEIIELTPEQKAAWQ